MVQERASAFPFLFRSGLEKQPSDLDRMISFLARESGLWGVTFGVWGVTAPISVCWPTRFLAPHPLTSYAPRRPPY